MRRDSDDNTSETGGNAERPASGFRDTYPGKRDATQRDMRASDALRQIREDAQDRAESKMDDRADDGEVTRTRRDAGGSNTTERTTRTERTDRGGPGLDDLGNLSETGGTRTDTPTTTAPRRTLPGPGGQGLPPGCTAPKVLMLTLSALVGQLFKR